jgi:uncharacterized protein YndB with AHSA1/START domain
MERFVYVTYIRARPEDVWRALTDAEFTRQYWEHDNVSDWQPGSRWEHRRSDASRAVDVVGQVVESAPPRKLVLTWAFPADPGRRSRVAFTLDPIEDMVKLTVVHDELDANMHAKISEGWPRVLASVKSLLETGRPLPTWAKPRA